MSQLQSHKQHSDVAGTRHSGHRWLMLACCIPAADRPCARPHRRRQRERVVDAFACVAMMAVMMTGMGHGRGDN